MVLNVVKAKEVMKWNKWIFSFLGLWPDGGNDIVFVGQFAYLFVHVSLELAELVNYLNNLSSIIANMTETAMFTMILFKLAIYRYKKSELQIVISAITEDFTPDCYKNEAEEDIFVAYNTMSKWFIRVALPFIMVGASMYFVTPMTGLIGVSDIGIVGNVTKHYELPYRTRLFFDITEIRTYILMYASQLPPLFYLIFGATGTDCLLVTLMLHICGQMAILTFRIAKLKFGPNEDDKLAIRTIVERHIRLIWLARVLDNSFNVLLLGQLIGTVIVICCLSWGAIANSDLGQMAHVLTFVLCTSSMLVVLYGYCFIGECLITESTKLHDAFYTCEWYKMPTSSVNSLLICMSQAQKPMYFTAGKFYILSLPNFTNIMKTTMAYFSVLRSFM